MTRILRCAACTKRIKPQHSHIGLVDFQTGDEKISYHARRVCQERGTEEIAARLERGKVFILRHHHSALCPDAASGFGCVGGCFDPVPREVAN